MPESSFWLDRPVAVTGATGLVGGHLVRRLLEQGATVICLVRDSQPHSLLFESQLHRRTRLVWGDVTNQDLVERLLNENEIRSIFHLAAQAIVSAANRNPVSTFDSNIRGTWCLLEAARRCPTVGQIVIASSDKAYGSHSRLPYDETAPLQARHPYDVSKACADMLAQSYAATYGLPVAITRCGNFFGAGDLNWNRIIPGTIRDLLRGRRPLIRSDGRFVRDYFYVEDGAAAYMTLAERLAEDDRLHGEAFNFSNEEPLTVLEVVEAVTAMMGSNLRPVVRGEANNEIREQFLSASKARHRLGWRPLYSFSQGLRQTIPWYRDRLDCGFPGSGDVQPARDVA